MKNILFEIGLVDVIADVASCIVILIGKENIQCSLVNVEVVSSLFDQFLCLESSTLAMPESPSSLWCMVLMAITLLVSASYSAPGLVISWTDFTLEEEIKESSEAFATFLPSM